jgi:hypothetical protein
MPEFEKNTIKEAHFEFRVYSHFNNLELYVPIRENELEEGFKSQKDKEIESMPLDLLYLYAVFYVNTFQKLNDSSFTERCEKLEKILEEVDSIWKLKGKKHNYNKGKNRVELQKVLLKFFGSQDNILNLSSELNDIMNQSFGDHFVSLREYSSESNLERLIRDSIPTCYAIMKNQVTNGLINWNTKRDFKKNTFSNTLAYVLISPVLLTLSPIFLLGYLMAHESYIDTLRDAFQSLEYRKKIALCLPYAGCYEKLVIEEFKSTGSKPDKIFRTILCNRRIRDILSEDWIIGVVGKKKCGKSTFVERIIPGANAQADASIATRVMSPYKIIESVVLIDYPHFDSTDFKHKLQFFFTRKLLGHTFMICNAMEVMDSDDTEKLFNLVQSHGGHFTILF